MILTVWILLPYIFFIFLATKMQAYIIFTAPVIFIATALFWHYLYVYRDRFRFRLIPWVVLILLLALPSRYSLERITPFTVQENGPSGMNELKNIEPEGNNYVIFNVD